MRPDTRHDIEALLCFARARLRDHKAREENTYWLWLWANKVRALEAKLKEE